jgi:hypothetical protein
LIYDDVLNITWLQDANYAKSSGYDDDGLMHWEAATAWAANLYFGGYTDWRLPAMIDTGALGCDWANSGSDCGYNMQTVNGSSVYSELAYMYYANLDLKGLYNLDGSTRSDWGVFGNGTTNGVDNFSFGQKDVGLIINLKPWYYWFGSEYEPDTTSAWVFRTLDGPQFAYGKGYDLYAWAVRPGDVAAVPEADTWAMLLAGLGLVGVVAKRRRD